MEKVVFLVVGCIGGYFYTQKFYNRIDAEKYAADITGRGFIKVGIHETKEF